MSEKEEFMQGTIKGLNVGIIKNEDALFALVLKVNQHDEQFHTYYLQPLVLFDMVQILMSRSLLLSQRIASEGDAYLKQLAKVNEVLANNTPQIEMSEIQQPEAGKRITSLTLKPGETHVSIIAILQNENVVVFEIDDMQIGMMLLLIQQAINNAGDTKFNNYINSCLDYIPVYATDLTGMPKINYEHFEHPEWKHNLFSHYLAVLYCFDTENGKQILSGAVIKTSVEHRSEREKNIVTSLSERCPKLNAFVEKYPLCQVITHLITVPKGKMASIDECLSPLREFSKQMQQNISH